MQLFQKVINYFLEFHWQPFVGGKFVVCSFLNISIVLFCEPFKKTASTDYISRRRKSDISLNDFSKFGLKINRKNNGF